MIKLNRTTEYGLIALRHMSRKQPEDPSGVTSAREIADTHHLPFEILAKTLQRLKDTGLIISAQGARGGYTLARPLSEITLAEFLEMMEGPQGVVSCTSPGSHAVSNESCCSYSPHCEMRDPMHGLNKRVRQFLSTIRLAEIAETCSLGEGLSGAALVVGDEP